MLHGSASSTVLLLCALCVGCGSSNDEGEDAASDSTGGSTSGGAGGTAGGSGGTEGGESGEGGETSSGGTGGGTGGTGGGAGGTGGESSTAIGVCEVSFSNGVEVEITSPCDPDTGEGTVDVAVTETPAGVDDLDEIEVVGPSVSITVNTPPTEGTLQLPIDPEAVNGDIVVVFIPEGGEPTFIVGAVDEDAITVDLWGSGTYTPVELVPAVLPGCEGTETDTDVTIDAGSQLASLTGVHRIRGSLTITASDLPDLDALECLRIIEGGLTIESASSLIDTQGLGNLVIVRGGFSSVGSSSLTSVSLPGLIKLDQGLNIQNNASLAEVDFESLVAVGADLTIHHSGGSAVVTSIRFPALTRIVGTLWLYDNDAHTDLDGFAALVRIDSNLDIAANDRLTNTDSLAALSRIEGGVVIDSNPALTSFAVPALRNNPDGTLIQYNASLAEISMPSVDTLASDLSIHDNGASADLTSIDFGALTTIQGALLLYNNSAHADLDGFGALARIDGDLEISGNASLTNTDGLAELSLIEGGLVVESNPALVRLRTPELADLGADMSVRYNEQLPTCEPTAIREALLDVGWDGNATITDNLADSCPGT